MDAWTKPGRGRTIWLTLVLALGTGLLAVWGTERTPQPRPVEPATQRSLTFAQSGLNVRTVPPVGTFDVHFDFVNSGDRPLRIEELKPSCGCLRPRLYDDQREFKPGEQGRFYVGVRTATEEPGPHRYSVTVNYNDGAPQSEEVQFRLVVPERKVLVEPAQLLFYQLSGTPDSRRVLVTDARGHDLQIQSVELSTPIKGVTATVEPRVRDDAGYWQTPIRVDVAAEFPPERQIAFLNLTTNDSEYPTIKVALMVQGRPVEDSDPNPSPKRESP